jgi:hypothetical protein
LRRQRGTAVATGRDSAATAQAAEPALKTKATLSQGQRGACPLCAKFPETDAVEPVVAIGSRFWRRALNSDSAAIGHTLTLKVGEPGVRRIRPPSRRHNQPATTRDKGAMTRSRETCRKTSGVLPREVAAARHCLSTCGDPPIAAATVIEFGGGAIAGFDDQTPLGHALQSR